MFRSQLFSTFLCLVLLGVIATVTLHATDAPSSMIYTGVNLAGAEFSPTALPGKYDTDYTYPNRKGVDYFLSKGMNVIRLPFLWERLQQQQFSDLNPEELSRLNNLVAYINSKGATVVLDPHNYGRYYGRVLGREVSFDAFADFWSKLASLYKNNNKVIFGLMNEPHTMPTELWRDAANKAISAIRKAGAGNLILVPGNAWTGADSWHDSWYGTPNANAMLSIVDPAKNYAFEVHQYLDGLGGSTKECRSETIGSQKLSTFTSWLEKNGKQGFLGEFAGGRNQTCYAALKDMLNYVHRHANVWMGWTYWAAGPWWGDYMYSLEPNNGKDRPQMEILRNYLR